MVLSRAKDMSFQNEMVGYLINYSEIGLKGKQVFKFEQYLKSNIKDLVNLFLPNIKVEVRFSQKRGRLRVLKSEANTSLKQAELIKKIDYLLTFSPGLASYARIISIIPYTPKQSLEEIVGLIKGVLISQNLSIGSLDIKRYDKSLSFTSLDLFNRLKDLVPQEIAKELRDDGSMGYDRLKILIYSDKIEIALVKKAIGGLPVGASGRGLVLLSGGIDSPVAAFLAAKRGLAVDLLHFYPGDSIYSSIEEFKNHKIVGLWKRILYFNPRARLFFVPTYFLLQKLKEHKPNYRMVIFKRFMVSLATKLGRRLYKKDFAIISGDSLGQVASQTLNNLWAVSDSACAEQVLLLRPLIGFNKVEIEQLAKFIGTYEISILPYEDFCSGLTGGTKTKANLKKILEFESQANISGIIKQTMDNIIKITPNDWKTL